MTICLRAIALYHTDALSEARRKGVWLKAGTCQHTYLYIN